MRQSKTLAKLREGKLARVCALGTFSPPYVRHAAHYGFDCIWFDLEHRAMSDREVQALLAFFHLYDIDCMLRPSTLEKSRLYRYLEDGATGLMIPHTSTADKARSLVQAIKFPPLGDRGLDGAGMDSGFFVDRGDDYPQQANRETFLAVQIETPQAVANVEEIAAVEGVDALFIGPGDLGLRLSSAPQAKYSLDEATERVAAAARKFDKAWGRPAASLEELSRFHDQGARLIAYGGEYMALMRMLEQCAADFERVAAS